jgi:hypothetical protein
LNVSSNSSGEEEITLLPSLSSFFSKYISSSYWEQSVFTPGFFTRLLKGNIYSTLIPTSIENIDNKYMLNISNPQGYFEAQCYDIIDLQKNFKPFYKEGEENKYFDLNNIKLQTTSEFTKKDTKTYHTKGLYTSTITVIKNTDCCFYTADGEKHIGRMINQNYSFNSKIKEFDIGGRLDIDEETNNGTLTLIETLFLNQPLTVSLKSNDNITFTDEKNRIFTPNNTTNSLRCVTVIFDQLNENSTIKTSIQNNIYDLHNKHIPFECLQKPFNILVGLEDTEGTSKIENDKLFMEVFIGVEPSEEDQIFATVADECP